MSGAGTSWLNGLGQKLAIAGTLKTPTSIVWNFVSGVTAAYNNATGQWDLTVTGGSGGSGDVTGPGSSIVDRLVLMAGTTGKVIKQSAFGIADLVKINGSAAFTSDQSMGGFRLINVAAPSAGTDAANKAYVDAHVSGGAGGGMGFRFTFSTTTTDADPGAGTLRANNATLSSATTLYVDLAEYGGTDVTAWLDSLDDYAGAIKGVVRLSSQSDPTKWIEYTLTGWTTATGYRKLTVVYKDGPGGLLTTAGDTFFAFDYASSGVSAADATITVSGAGAIARAAVTGDVAIAGGSNTSVISSLAWSKLASAIGNLGFTGLKSLSYNGEINNTGATPAINFTTGDLQKLTLSGNATPTFTAPAGIGWVQVCAVGDGTQRTITWPGSVVGTLPLPSAGSGVRTFYPFFYDGTSYHFSADDLSSFLKANGTVSLTAAWAVGNFALTGLRNLSYTSEVATTGSTPAVNFTTGDLQKTTLSAATATPTFTAPPGIGEVQWHVQQDATGGRTVVFPGSVLGSPPQPNQVASSHTFYDFFWDGANYHYRSYGAAPGTEIDNGSSGTADTINMSAGTYQKSLLTGNCVFTFSPPSGVGVVQLRLIQDSSGSRTVTWPSTVIWPAAGTPPTLSTTPGDDDVISFFWDGTNYRGTTNKVQLAQIVPSGTNGRVLVTIGGVATWGGPLGNNTDAMVVNGSDVKLQVAGGSFLHAVSLSSRKIVGLFGDVTTTQMPANTGDGMVFIASRTTAPTAAVVGGAGVYAGTSGELCAVSTTDYLMKLGDGTRGVELRAGGATLSAVRLVANSGGGTSEWTATFDSGRFDVVASSGGTGDYQINYNGGALLKLNASKLGFFGTAAQSKQAITGSRGGNAALADLLTKLATIGLITDSSS